MWPRVQNDILCNAENHGEAILILDLSAAFDTFDQEVLLNRMKSQLGIDVVV
jgi:hypothetical protein